MVGGDLDPRRATRPCDGDRVLDQRGPDASAHPVGVDEEVLELGHVAEQQRRVADDASIDDRDARSDRPERARRRRRAPRGVQGAARGRPRWTGRNAWTPRRVRRRRLPRPSGSRGSRPSSDLRSCGVVGHPLLRSFDASVPLRSPCGQVRRRSRHERRVGVPALRRRRRSTTTPPRPGRRGRRRRVRSTRAPRTGGQRARARRPGAGTSRSIRAGAAVDPELGHRLRGVGDGVDDVGGLPGHRLDRGACDVRARGAAGEAEQRAARVRVPPRRAEAGERGDEHDAAGVVDRWSRAARRRPPCRGCRDRREATGSPRR